MSAFALSLAVAQLLHATAVVGKPDVSISGSHAVVKWKTDVECGTRLKIEPAAKVEETKGQPPSIDHQVTIDDLKPGTDYQITIGTARKWLLTQSLTGQANAPATVAAPTPAARSQTMPRSGRSTWGNPSSLPDHFARHGGDFGATSPQDYAQKAADFLEQARQQGLPAKRTPDGVLRVFDPKTGAFAAYNRNGTTKTFFKPGRPGYFERQPGRPVDLRHEP